jgi:SAM-dependent methyltransferase
MKSLPIPSIIYIYERIVAYYMEKITKPLKPRNKENIFTEGINYFETGKGSIWGSGNRDILKLLKRIRIRGRWLNLAAGDGRYNQSLLRKADSVVVSDIDAGALSKLWRYTPKEYKLKLKTEIFDITKRFPFEDHTFDGVFCTGILHLFPKHVFMKIFAEIDRVLRPNGRIIIEFVTDIKRIAPNGKRIVFGDEPQYTLSEAKKLLRKTFRNYMIKMLESEVPEEDFAQANPPYKFSCKLILLIADKRSEGT